MSGGKYCFPAIRVKTLKANAFRVLLWMVSE